MARHSVRRRRVDSVGSDDHVAPVIVVGNGPVGQTAALLLARWDIPVLLIDRRPARELLGSKAICQQRDVLSIWDSVGAGEQIAAEGVTWTTARTYYGQRELFHHGFVDAGTSPFPPFVNISQSRTEQILEERIAASPMVATRWGCEVVGVRQDDDGVTLACKADDADATLRAQYVLVCSGARCPQLHEALGVDFAGHSFDDRFLICDIRTNLPDWATERRFYFDPVWNPGRQVLIHPCPDSTFRIDWQVPASYDLLSDETSGELDHRIRQIIGPARYQIVWKSVYRFASRIADTMRVGRVLLAGDSAHLMAPFGARGLNSGVQDAENATWKLAFVLRGWAPESVLTSYHQERHAAAEENLSVTTATMDFLVPRTPQQRTFRHDVLERALTDESARDLVDSGRLAEPFWYVESPLTTPSEDHPFTGRPARGAVPRPGPGVLVPDIVLRPDDSPSRLHRLARRGLTLLTIGDGARRVATAAVESVRAPAHVWALDSADASSGCVQALGARPGEIWLIRPDAHVAAVVRGGDVDTVTAAVRRSLGWR